MKTLVVYYSLSGTTRAVAEALARELTAEIEEIRCARYQRGVWVFLRGSYDSATGNLPPIERPTHTPTAYDLVVIGGPIWASHPAPPVRAYLQHEAGRFTNAAFFLTHGGSSPVKAIGEMEALGGVTPKATLVVRESDVKAGRFAFQVSSFAGTLRKSMAAERKS
jgi:flavodoxin